MYIIEAILFAALGCLLTRSLIPAGWPQAVACLLCILAAFGWGGWGGARVLPVSNGNRTPNYILSIVLIVVVIFVALRFTGHL